MRIFTTIALIFLCASPVVAEGNEEFDLNDADLIIDVRTPPEFNIGHLEGAINMRYKTIGSKIGSVASSKEDVIYIYCRSGKRSKIAAGDLVKRGYRNARDIGSYSDYAGISSHLSDYLSDSDQ